MGEDNFYACEEVLQMQVFVTEGRREGQKNESLNKCLGA